jgi:propanediol dehydratase small subunit
MVSFSKAQIAEIIRKVGDGASSETLENAIKNVMTRLQADGLSVQPPPLGGTIDASSYPLGLKRKDLVKSATGLGLDDITLEKVIAGEIQFEDIKTRPETLAYQTQIAESVNRPNLASNLKRAGEMTRIPDTRLLEMYNALRPYRSTKQELLLMAEELEEQFQAPACAVLVREAASAYEKNNRLKGDR